VPAALDALTGDFLVTKYLHSLSLRQRFLCTSPLQVNAVTVRAFEDESVGVVHILDPAEKVPRNLCLCGHPTKLFKNLWESPAVGGFQRCVHHFPGRASFRVDGAKVRVVAACCPWFLRAVRDAVATLA